MDDRQYSRIARFGLLSVVIMAATACSEAEEQKQKVGMPNPAAVFCEKLGEYDLATGKCKLKNGDVVDAWEYYRQHSKE